MLVLISRKKECLSRGRSLVFGGDSAAMTDSDDSRGPDMRPVVIMSFAGRYDRIKRSLIRWVLTDLAFYRFIVGTIT